MGVLAGLARLGVATDVTARRAPEHGPLLVVGLFVTVIALERAVAFGRSWAALVPILAAATAAALIVGSPLAPWAAVASAVGLTAVNAALVWRRPALFGWLTWGGSLLLLLGNLVWAGGRGVVVVVPAWLAFLVLTIAAERVRWSRSAALPRWALPALTVVAAGLAALVVARVTSRQDVDRAIGVALVLVAVWQFRFDVARHALAQSGMTRFIGLGVLAGTAWLLVGGVLLAWQGLPPAGPIYDAVLHAVFVGHVFGTVFAHAPTMLASVAGARVPFSRALYWPAGLLHLSLVMRVAGDLCGSLTWRQAGSVGNAIAMAAFAMAAAGSHVHLRRTETEAPRMGKRG